MSSKTFGLILGLVCFILPQLLPTFETFVTAAERMIASSGVKLDSSQLASSMQSTLALLLLMVIWWVTEAVPLPATALLPAALLPWFHLAGVDGNAVVHLTPRHILPNYASPVIFLFLGGFLIAAAMQKWKLDRRFTLWFLTRGNLANDSRSVLLGIMAVTAFLSMWISNTATAAMMLPLGIGILSFMGIEPGVSRYGNALMLGIAWAASIGGIGTIIGTPPNGIALGILNSTFANDPSFQRITFLDWMTFGVPYVILFVPIAWFVLLKLNPPELIALPGGKEKLLLERTAFRSFSAGEKGTIAVFLLVVFLWVSNPFWGAVLPENIAASLTWVDEYSIGIFAGALLFIVPTNVRKGDFVLTWKDTKYVDWGTLILFGGGIALSDAMFKTGLAAWIATSFTEFAGAQSTLVMMFFIVLLVDFLTEITSNTAVTSMIVPIVISVAIATGENPTALTVAAALAASMAFMLPVATPPNALVYGTGYVQMKEMVRSGFVLDMLGWLFTIGVVTIIGGWVFGVIKL